jgi:hypothetical protein
MPNLTLHELSIGESLSKPICEDDVKRFTLWMDNYRNDLFVLARKALAPVVKPSPSALTEVEAESIRREQAARAERIARAADILFSRLCIVNEADRPCARLVAYAIPGTDQCAYLGGDHASWGVMADTCCKNFLTEFGFILHDFTFTGGMHGSWKLRLRQTRPVTARYVNGRTRQWQETLDPKGDLVLEFPLVQPSLPPKQSIHYSQLISE